MEENKDFAEEPVPSLELTAENKAFCADIDSDADEDKKDGIGEKENTGALDYGELMHRDIEELHTLFPHLYDKKSVLELDNPLRYAALRDLGLSPKEAYLASSNINVGYDNRSHITSSAPRGASSSSDMLSANELEAARIIFSDLSDRDIQKLYKKVTK